MITRHHAGKVLRNHMRGDKWKLDNNVKPRAVSEDTILESGKTYSIPIFLYNLGLPINHSPRAHQRVSPGSIQCTSGTSGSQSRCHLLTLKSGWIMILTWAERHQTLSLLNKRKRKRMRKPQPLDIILKTH